MKSNFRALLVFSLSILCYAATAQNGNSQNAPSNSQYNYEGRQGGWWFSWGYNKEWYTHSDIHIKQPSLGNNYTFKSVFAEDHPGWDDGIFNKAISIPQYNYRIGHWFKDNWGIEINFDHTKYQVAQMQALHVVGTMNNQPVNKYMLNDSLLVYQLNNGANFFLFNLVHRVQIGKLNYKNFNTSLLWKAGVGFMVPHVQNTIFGKDNNQGFQFGGLDAGFEAAMRFTFYKYVYLEYCNKVVYTNYWGLKVYDGTARQSFGTYEMILNLGLSLPLGHPDKHKHAS
ncbi:MAG TPA: hypothetical protein VL547_16685 [Dinghuibacter sp.]|uniref:hypothetical protein n=1 Tax=Dinghuibacter sp. TaxID=2024697 RepID=UPI002C1C913B|nr:hypothetical protein [Dinghuibacter sp.]HTJ13676.1 hypothetical protein [Dinghuibacter sp.]